MEEEINRIVTETNRIISFRKFKDLMFELLRGYPNNEYFGKFESMFPFTGKKVVTILDNHKIIEQIPIEEVKAYIQSLPSEDLQKLPLGEERFIWYRLTAKGVNLAIAIINLEHSERTQKLTRKMERLTEILAGIGILTIILMGVQLFFQMYKYLQIS